MHGLTKEWEEIYKEGDKLKNKKGQVTLIVILVGFTLLALTLISAYYISSLSARGSNKINNRQLSEISDGSVYYAMARLKNEIDFNYMRPTKEVLNYQFPFNGNTGKFTSTVNTYQENNNTFNSSLQKQFLEVGPVNKVIYLNNRQDVCFQITWDKGPTSGQYATVRFEVLKEVIKSDGTKVYQSIQLPVEDSSGMLGTDPTTCSTTGQNSQAKIPANLIYHRFDPNKADGATTDNKTNTTYDPVNPDVKYLNNSTLDNHPVNGYGGYKILISVPSGEIANLQTKALYNRLSYRTFEIKTTAQFDNYVKNNTRAIVQAYYDTDETNVTPKFKYIRWYEGDE
jgi:hypothetical protein